MMTGEQAAGAEAAVLALAAAPPPPPALGPITADPAWYTITAAIPMDNPDG